MAPEFVLFLQAAFFFIKLASYKRIYDALIFVIARLMIKSETTKTTYCYVIIAI